jgi:hypothetical protein
MLHYWMAANPYSGWSSISTEPESLEDFYERESESSIDDYQLLLEEGELFIFKSTNDHLGPWVQQDIKVSKVVTSTNYSGSK